MDVLSDVVRSTHSHDGSFSMSYLNPPWGLRIQDQAPLTLHVVVRGHAHVRVVDDGVDVNDRDSGADPDDTLLLQAGDVVLVRGTHLLTDHPATRPGAVVYGPRRNATPFESVTSASDRWRMDAPRTYGDGTEAPTVLIHATYRAGSILSQRLLAALPPALRVPAPQVPAPLRELLAAEVPRDGHGQQAVLDRLLDLLLVMALRSWLADPVAETPAWADALQDPHVGPALNAVHDSPQLPWTISGLAAHAGTSRAHLARRFGALLGQPPITYLTRYRIDLAAELIATTDRPLAAIAREVGYSDAFSLSTAYRRVTGAPPRTHRHSRRGADEAPR